MDVRLRSLAVCVVGWSMAAMGILASITVSLVTIAFPDFHFQVPEDSQRMLRRRIGPRVTRLPGELDFSPSASSCAVASDSCSADSLQSVNTVHSELSTSHQATSTPPTSLPDSPEFILRNLPSTFPAQNGKSEGRSSAVAQHTCTPQRCSNRASTSETGSSPSADHENAEKGAKSGWMHKGDTKIKNTRAMRAVSWLKSSPPPTFLQQQQRTPRSSGESSRAPVPASPVRACTFDECALETRPAVRREPRRASTLLGFKRFAKTPVRSDSELVPASLTSVSIVPVPGGRRSEPASPVVKMQDLPGASSDTERTGREQKRRVSYFARLRRKSSGKDSTKATTQQNAYEEEIKPEVNTPMPVSEIQPSKEITEANERGRSSGKRCAKSKSLREGRRSRRPATAPSMPAPRTNPYEAPYNFPTPVSPEAAGYVKLARTEIWRGTSVSPSVAVRRLYQGQDDLPPVPPLPGAAEVGPGSMQQTTYSNTAGVGSSPVPQSAPAHRTTFAVSAPKRQGHCKSASVSGTSPTVDEFGFVYPSVGDDGRHGRAVVNRMSVT